MSRKTNRAAPPESPSEGRAWTFLSNHAHVLISIASDPDARMRDVAERVGITERAVQNILGDLEREGLVTREREGRRNHYVLDLDQPLRHPLESHRTVRELIQLVTRPTRLRRAARPAGRRRGVP